MPKVSKKRSRPLNPGSLKFTKGKPFQTTPHPWSSLAQLRTLLSPGLSAEGCCPGCDPGLRCHPTPFPLCPPPHSRSTQTGAFLLAMSPPGLKPLTPLVPTRLGQNGVPSTTVPPPPAWSATPPPAPIPTCQCCLPPSRPEPHPHPSPCLLALVHSLCWEFPPLPSPLL